MDLSSCWEEAGGNWEDGKFWYGIEDGPCTHAAASNLPAAVPFHVTHKPTNGKSANNSPPHPRNFPGRRNLPFPILPPTTTAN